MNKEYVDDSDLTEITILPDGRIYAFGLSAAVRDLLAPLREEAECVGAEPESSSASEVV